MVHLRFVEDEEKVEEYTSSAGVLAHLYIILGQMVRHGASQKNLHDMLHVRECQPIYFLCLINGTAMGLFRGIYMVLQWSSGENLTQVSLFYFSDLCVKVDSYKHFFFQNKLFGNHILYVCFKESKRQLCPSEVRRERNLHDRHLCVEWEDRWSYSNSFERMPFPESYLFIEKFQRKH